MFDLSIDRFLSRMSLFISSRDGSWYLSDREINTENENVCSPLFKDKGELINWVQKNRENIEKEIDNALSF